jgi:osmotically inducible lipoprotein OsmB
LKEPHATRYEAPQTHCWIKGIIMKQIQKISFGVVAAVMLLSLGGCAGMSTQDKNTAIGAGVGAVGGAVLTGGSTTGTIGGAAVGGVIGHEVDKDE